MADPTKLNLQFSRFNENVTGAKNSSSKDMRRPSDSGLSKSKSQQCPRRRRMTVADASMGLPRGSIAGTYIGTIPEMYADNSSLKRMSLRKKSIPGLRRGSMWNNCFGSMQIPPSQLPQKLNTYKLEPTDQEKFVITHELKSSLEEILSSQLEGVTYDPKAAQSLCRLLSDQLKAKTREINEAAHRYKIVVIVNIGEASNMEIMLASRCVWNPQTDKYCNVEYKNDSLCAFATLYALYAE